MISNDERNKTGRNIRESQLDQVLERVRDFFHHSNRDETIRTEIQRFEFFQFLNCDDCTVTGNER